MNKIITVYELLGLTKDGKAPKKIKVLDNFYEYDKYNKFYYNKNGYSLYRLFLEGGNCLDEEVEILEEYKPIIQEIHLEDMYNHNEIKVIDIELQNAINEIIRYINKKESE